MIYTVTFNPSLDYIVSVENFRTGCTNRTASELLVPGGKGINVSLVLKNLGIQSTALGFTAGFVGDQIETQLREMGVSADFIRLAQGVSRINVKLQSVEGTEINGNGPQIGDSDVRKLAEKLDALSEKDVLFLSGSVPRSLSDQVYADFAKRLEGRGVLVAVDAVGELLLSTLKYRPFLIKPNHQELGEIFKVTLRDRDAVIPYGRRLQEKGARNVLISLAGEGAVLVAEDGRIFEAPAPQGKLVNGTGAGDAMAAGFMAGWMESGDYAHAFFMGLAAGSASAFSSHFAQGDRIRSLCRQLLDDRSEADTGR